jgi:hypothetical protein
VQVVPVCKHLLLLQAALKALHTFAGWHGAKSLSCLLPQIDAYLEHLQQEFDQLETGHSSQSAASTGRLMHGEAQQQPSEPANTASTNWHARGELHISSLLLAQQCCVHLQCWFTTDLQTQGLALYTCCCEGTVASHRAVHLASGKVISC